MSSWSRRGLLVATLLLLAGAGHTASDSNRWRMQFSEGAKSDGVIVVEIAPEGSEAFQVSVPIADGTRENAVARAVASVLKAQLSKDQFHVEVDDGEDVLVKKTHGSPNFGLRIVSNSVKAVRINLDKE